MASLFFSPIRSSEYTDKIENPPYTRRAFSMGRKSKYSAEEKLLILSEVLRNGIHNVITKYKISKNLSGVEFFCIRIKGCQDFKQIIIIKATLKKFKTHWLNNITNR